MKKSFKFNKLCKICTGKNPETGEELRPQIETLKAEGVTNREIILWADKIGVKLNPTNIVGHFKTHAPYVVKGSQMSPTTKRVITQLTLSGEESMNALRKIIGMGNVMIDNWWKAVHGEEVTGPIMPITEKMLGMAIREEGKRAPKTALDEEFENLQKKAIEGEVVNAKSESTQLAA